MTFLHEPITMSNLADMSMCDNAFGYIEFANAARELVDSGHIKEEFLNGSYYYSLTYKGHATSEVFEKELPSPVRDAARKSAARVIHAIKRDAAIVTEQTTRSDGTLGVKLAFMDEDGILPMIDVYTWNTDEDPVTLEDMAEWYDANYDLVQCEHFYEEGRDYLYANFLSTVDGVEYNNCEYCFQVTDNIIASVNYRTEYVGDSESGIEMIPLIAIPALGWSLRVK